MAGATGSLFSYVDLEKRTPARHPLRRVRQIVNDALTSLDAEFDRLHAAQGCPSIAPQRLLRASLVQILFPTVFSKNRDRLLTTDIASRFLAAVLAHREVAPLLSDEHFADADLRLPVNGTLIKAGPR